MIMMIMNNVLIGSICPIHIASAMNQDVMWAGRLGILGSE